MNRKLSMLRESIVVSRQRCAAGLAAVQREVDAKEVVTDDDRERIARLDQTVKVHDAFIKMIDAVA